MIAPLYNSWCMQIEVNNYCHLACVYCSRYIRHYRPDQRFHMDIQTFEKAVESLDGWTRKIGLIGGEPLLHPNFEELCRILQKHNIPKEKLGLWTSMTGERFEKYRKIIKETFSFLGWNVHNELQRQVCLHQPSTIAIDEVIENKDVVEKLIDDCWIPRIFSPSIGPKGGFFCEVAYALDSLLDGPGGVPIEPNWWKQDPKNFQYQRDFCCKQCGMAIPIKRELLMVAKEKITPKLFELFKKLNLRRISEDDIILFNEKLTEEQIENNRVGWTPWDYRGDLPTDVTRCYPTDKL